MSPVDHDETWRMFNEEATEALEDLAHVVDALSASGGSSEAIGRALRILHNVKGAARVAGAEGVEIVAHALEGALGAHREGKTPLDAALDALREGLGLIYGLLGGDVTTEAARAFVATLDPESTSAQTSTPDVESDVPNEGALTQASAWPRQTTLVRVEASRLDGLLHFADELLAAQGRRVASHEELESCAAELWQLEQGASGEPQPALRTLAQRLDALLGEMRHDVLRAGHLARDWSVAVKRARMLPLAGAIPHWRRTVAETARALGRQARLVAEVGDVEVDRQILEALRDPMMHLLRNAVDHGLEPPDERERAGKPRVGTIRVCARAPGMMVELLVSDDGRGLSALEIGKRAVERGLASAEGVARMSAAELSDLVFVSGFSTARAVSHVSGRGLGLHIVRERLSEIGGHVWIVEAGARGCVFRAEVPATVVSTRALLVRTARATYALPAAYVARAFRVAAGEVRFVDGAATVADAKGEPLRLRWLSALMQEPRRPDADKLLVVILSDGASRVGVVVDEVVGEVEAVAKRLPWNLPRLPGIAGAMVVGTGALAVVIEVPSLLEMARQRSERTESVALAAPAAKRRILVVDDSLTSRTLERNILTAAGYEVETANDGEAGWQALQASAFDLVVTDIQMPRLDGVELTRRIRAHAKLKRLPVILVTSLDRPADLAQGSAAGADEYIVKGRFDQRKLLEAVARLL